MVEWGGSLYFCCCLCVFIRVSSYLIIRWFYIFHYESCFVSFLPRVSGESPLALDSDRFRISFTKHETIVLDGSSGQVVTFGTAHRLDEYVCSWPSYCTHAGTILPSTSIQAGDALFPSKICIKDPFRQSSFFFFGIVFAIWKNSNINKKVAVSETIWFPLHHMRLCPTRDVSHCGLMSFSRLFFFPKESHCYLFHTF